jgi:hypothetical protein
MLGNIWEVYLQQRCMHWSRVERFKPNTIGNRKYVTKAELDKFIENQKRAVAVTP